MSTEPKYVVLEVPWSVYIPGLKPYITLNTVTGELVADEHDMRTERALRTRFAAGTQPNRVTKVSY